MLICVGLSTYLNVSQYDNTLSLFTLFSHLKWWTIIIFAKCPLGAVSIRKTVLPGMAIPMLKIRRPNGRLIFNMGIPIPGKDGLYIETGPRTLVLSFYTDVVFTLFIWNSTHSTLPRHCEMWFLYSVYDLRAVKFKSSYVLLKCPLISVSCYVSDAVVSSCRDRGPVRRGLLRVWGGWWRLLVGRRWPPGRGYW